MFEVDEFFHFNAVKLNANRMVVGTLRGFDQFMNLVVDNTVEVNGDEKTDIGMVVSHLFTIFLCSVLVKSLLQNYSPVISILKLVLLSCCRCSEAIVLSQLKHWNL
jgi:small nuclear ribonucleoprotein (snRNP)-like protein